LSALLINRHRHLLQLFENFIACRTPQHNCLSTAALVWL